MKRALSSLLVFALVLTLLVPAFAFAADKTTEEKFNELKEKGLLNGVEDGSAALDRELTRAELAAILVRLFKLEPITGQSSFIDVPAEHWAQKEGVIEAVAKAGLMGSTTTYSKTFSPDAKLTIAEVAKVAVSALKLTVDENAKIDGVQPWAAPYVDAALKAGLIAEAKNYHANANRGILVDAAYVIYTTVINPVTGATKVESVKADNLKQVVVTFDGTVDAKTAEDTSNYSIDGFTFDSAVLSEDGKSVVLTLDDTSSKFDNQKTYKLTVDNVKNTEGKYVAKADKVAFTPVDVTIPTVKEVTALGTKALKVTFSEPVQRSTAGTTASYKIDGKSIAGHVDYVFPDAVIINTTMTTGDHKITVSGVKDFADFLVSGEVAFNVAEDTAAPEIVDAKAYDLKKVVLNFNEPVKAASKVYHTSASLTGSVSGYGTNKLTVTFSNANRLGLGQSTVYVIAVEDYSGNKADRTVVVSPELDQEKPTVTSASVKAESGVHKFTITFSKSVNDSTTDSGSVYNKANYTLKDSAGKVVVGSGFDANGHPATTISYDADKKQVTFSTVQALKAGKYTLEVAGVQDQAYVANTMLPYSVELEIGDVSATTVSKVWVEETVINGTTPKYDSTIFVRFNKPVASEGDGNAVDVRKYYVSLAGGAFKPVLGANIEQIQPDTVMIALPRSTDSFYTYSGSTPTLKPNSQIRVSLVSDTAGNFINEPTLWADFPIGVLGTINVLDATATAKNKVEVIFDGVLTNINSGDFRVEKGTTSIAVNLEDHSSANGRTTAVFTLGNTELPADVSGYSFVVAANPASQDTFGAKVTSGSTTVNDGVIASPVKLNNKQFEVTTTGTVYTVKVKFDEVIKINSGTLNTELLSVKVSNGGSSSEIKIDSYSVDTTDNTILNIVLADSNEVGKLVKKSDGSKVTINDFSTITVTIKDANDVAKSIVDIAGNPVKPEVLSDVYLNVK